MMNFCFFYNSCEKYGPWSFPETCDFVVKCCNSPVRWLTHKRCIWWLWAEKEALAFYPLTGQTLRPDLSLPLGATCSWIRFFCGQLTRFQGLSEATCPWRSQHLLGLTLERWYLGGVFQTRWRLWVLQLTAAGRTVRLETPFLQGAEITADGPRTASA